MRKHVGIWLDHRRAWVVSLVKGNLPPRDDEVIFETFKSNMERKVRLSGGSRTRKTPYGPQDIAVDGTMERRIKQQLRDYYRAIIAYIQDADRIIIFGPGEAKFEFKKEIEKARGVAHKIKGVETTDKMTEKQIIAKVKKFYASYP